MAWKKFFAKPVPPVVPLQEIVQHFNEAAADEENFPSTIDPRIYHVQLILEYFGDLNGKRVLDVGCGKGRFARELAQRYPKASIVGFDLAEAMLKHVPTGVDACAGSMTALPFSTGAFDCAYATESLEHAVEIGAAIAEICRVVRPVGRIVIIDKNAEQWGRLKTPEWEKWFSRKELEKLLARHCAKVSSRPISYWEDVAPDGLFLAWLAER
jgi:malonyl-CoA O-methyltransferase